MPPIARQVRTRIDPNAWRRAVERFQHSSDRLSAWQVINSFVPFFALWYLMVRSLEVSYLLTLLLAIPTTGFVMRIFIILHDCGHGAFLKSQRISDVIGFVAGVITFTPYFAWRHSHAKHHATSGDLDRRGYGDVWTLTVDEYLALSPRKQQWYRIYRHPLVLFGIGPAFNFLVVHRFVREGDSRARERHSVHWTNLALLLTAVTLSALFGFWTFVLVELLQRSREL